MDYTLTSINLLANEAKFIGQQHTLPITVCLSNPHCASATNRH